MKSKKEDLGTELTYTLPYYNIVMHLHPANRLVKHTGYGNAAGLLLAHGLLAGGKDAGQENYSSDSETSDTEEYQESKKQYVNNNYNLQRKHALLFWALPGVLQIFIWKSPLKFAHRHLSGGGCLPIILR